MEKPGLGVSTCEFIYWHLHCHLQVCRHTTDMISSMLCDLRFLFEYCTCIDKTTSVTFIYIDAVDRNSWTIVVCLKHLLM